MGAADMQCFVDKVVEAVKILDVPVTSSGGPGAARSHESRDLEDLTSYLEDASHQRYSCRVISICQRNSWRPLQVTEPMLDFIVQKHEISSSFSELPSCFYSRNLELEEVFGVPFTTSTKGSYHEALYTLRYPEFKMSDGKWVLRQSGLYHRYNTTTSQSLYILLNPMPRSQLQERVSAYLQEHSQETLTDPFWLHRLLLSTHLPAWRHYIAAQEKMFLPMANSTFATFIDEPLRLGYDTLSTIVGLQNRFLQVPVFMEHTSELLDELKEWLTDMSGPHSSQETIKLGTELRNHKRHCQAYARSAEYMQRRAQSVAQLLSDTLSFRDQVEAKIQNGSMIQLNKSAVFITALTLLYLPSSFVASIFGMNFFDYDGETKRLVGTSMVWIYVVASVALTSITMMFYYWLLKRDGALFKSLAPKVRVTADWVQTPFANMTRRLTSRGNAGVELKELPI
ncbi:pho87 protein [Apiospora arundinis]